MKPAELQLSDRDAVAAFQLAADATPVRGTEGSSSPRDFVAVSGAALLPAAVLNAEERRGLRRLFASLVLAPASATVASAVLAPTNGALVAIGALAALSTSVGGAEKLVAGALVTIGEGAAATTTVGDAEAGTSLGALVATLVLALPVAGVVGAVRAAIN